MNKQFVTHEIALKLKELGFDEECFGYYKEGVIIDPSNVVYERGVHNRIHQTYNSGTISAPLWQQVIDWLFQKLDLHYPYLEIRIFSDYSGYWYQSADEFLEEPELEIDFDNKEEMVLEGIKLLEKCKK